MNFYIDSKELTAGVLSAIKALPVRTTMPILDGVLLEARKDGVRLLCSDLMMQKECFIPATVEEEGKVLLPGKFFCEVVRKLPDAIAQVRLDGNSINISCGRAKSSMQVLEMTEEFPEMKFTGDHFTVKLDRTACRDMILQTVFAVAQDESKPILTGALLELGENFNIVATDAYQFAMRSVPLTSPVPEKQIVVPGKSMVAIAHMMDETEEEAELTFTRTHVKVDIRHTCLVARLLDGDYIKYKQILPTSYKTRVLVDRKEMMESIDRAQLMAREGNNNIIIRLHDDKLQIIANSFVGNIHEEIDVQINGEDIEIAFNPKYCMNILKNIEDEKIYMDFTSPISPCVVRPVQGEAYFYLIVPVRIYSQF